MVQKTNRLGSLEGLRGLAAIAVAIYHSLLMFYPAVIFGVGSSLAPIQHGSWEGYIYGTPLGTFISGTFAVSIFFVISGFVLSIGFFESSKLLVVRKLAAKRYLRLMIPALASVMLAWLLLAVGLSHTQQASLISSSGWLAGMWNFVPNMLDALQQGVWGIFTSQNVYYNPVLWTMFYEFLGSFLVFAMLILFGKMQKRWIVYVAIIGLTYQSWYLGFVVGMMLADLYAHKRFPFDRPHIKLMVIALVAALIFGGYPLGSIVNTMYASITLPGLTPTANASLYTAVAATLLVTAAINLPQLRRLLEWKWVERLGKYTFSVYLVHKLVLFTVGAGLFVFFINHSVGYNWSALLALGIAYVIIAATAYLFEKYVDAPAILWSGKFANWFLELPAKTEPEAYTNVQKLSLIQQLAGKVRFVARALLSKRKTS